MAGNVYLDIDITPEGDDFYEAIEKCKANWTALDLPTLVGVDDSSVDQGDNTTTGTLAWHVAQVTKTVLITPGTYTISTSITVPTTMKLEFENGGILEDDTDNASLIINGQLETGLHQIFDFTNGTGAVSFGPQSVKEIYAQWWGAVPDFDYGTNTGTDNHTALEAAAAATPHGGTLRITAAQASQVGSSVDIDGGFATESEVAIPEYVNLIMDVPIYYTGASNETCLKIGTATNLNYNVSLDIKVVKAVQSDWSNDASVGVKLYSLNTSKVQNVDAEGFTVGVMFNADTQGFGYNTINIGEILNNKYGVYITNENSGYSNENLFLGGKVSNNTGVNATLDRYGIYITSEDDGYTTNNNNIFMKPCLEVNDAGSGTAYGIWIEEGTYNYFYHARTEGCDYGAKFSSSAGANYIDIASSGVATVEDTVTTVGDNKVYKFEELLNRNFSQEVFSVRNLKERWVAYDATTFAFKGLSIATSGGATIFANNIHFTINPNQEYIEISTTRVVGTKVDTANVKSFRAKRDVASAVNGGRFYVRCYDSAGAVLSGTSPYYARGELGTSLTYSASWGGIYLGAQDSNDSIRFHLHDDVKSIWFGIGGGTANAYVKGFSLYTDQYDFDARVWPGNDAIQEFHTATTYPNSGDWNVAEQVWEVTPASGATPGWICIDRVETEMRVAGVATDTILEVDDTTGMSASDVIGVELDTGAWHWSTVASVTDGDTVVIDDALPSGAAIDNDIITNEWVAMANLA